MGENNQKLYFSRLWLKTAIRIFLIFGLMLVEMILYHSAQTACPGKFKFLSYGVKSSRPIRLLDYFSRFWPKTALRIFLIIGLMLVEMILYHFAQTACPGKFKIVSYGVKSSQPIRLLDCFFRLWLKTALRIFLIFALMLVWMILYHSVQTACPGQL